MAAGAFLVFLLLRAVASAQQENSRIPVPSSLSLDSKPWYSPSGKFAFGFYNTWNGYTISIFYTGFSDRLVVWTAADKFDPVLPKSIVSLELRSNGVELLLCDQYGIPFSLYGKMASPGEAIAWASMLDNGNFVLYNSQGGVIWQSFDYPTNTLLPGQRLPPDGELVSRVSKTDLSRGMFRVKMQFDGNLVQYPVGTPNTAENAYYASHTDGSGRNVSLYLDHDGRLYLHNGIFCLHNFTSGGESAAGTFYLARVDPDGIFRVYNHHDDGNWTSMWTSIVDRCEVKGVCGVNSVCSSYQDQDQTAVSCTCLPGFSYSSAGCNQDYDIRDCRNNNSSVTYEIARMPNVTWIDNSYNVNYTTTEEDCRHACLNNCHCLAALFHNGQCRQQNFPLRYGRRSTSASTVALVRVTLPPDGTGNGKSHLQTYIVVIGVSTIGIAVLVIYHGKQNGFCGLDEESKENVNKFLLNHGSLAPKRYSYKQIRKITKSFTEKLGQGGYGIVYKGKLPDGLLVAVKVLRETNDNVEEFVNEVASISRTSHVNIVNLLGFCFERKKRALVYEFMPNKSLDKFIYKNGSANAECSLEWKKLYEISVGVARGLEYLHRGCNTKIVHFDIKPQNILLDQDFCPKISDFGLAKLCMKQQSSISMLGTRGTIGYIAPEVFSRNFGVVSHKSDVYSYGIMLLRMAEARTNIEIMPFQPSEICFLEKIYKHVIEKNEKVYDLMTEEEEEVVRRMLMVGFWCIQTAPSGRPSMDNVVDMLAGNLQSIEIPPLPFLLCSPKPQFSCSLSVIVETQSFT